MIVTLELSMAMASFTRYIHSFARSLTYFVGFCMHCMIKDKHCARLTIYKRISNANCIDLKSSLKVLFIIQVIKFVHFKGAFR